MTAAVGKQLDIIGKYQDVKRSGYGTSGQPITLNDADFLSLIKMAISRNNAQSDLSTIQNLMVQFFGHGAVLVFDYQNMQMSFLISDAVGSRDLAQLIVTEGLLPVPMGVGFSVIHAPVITNFFGCVTYQFPTAINNKPFNTYQSYNQTWPCVVYQDGVVAP